jgi:hypothetical protein
VTSADLTLKVQCSFTQAEASVMQLDSATMELSVEGLYATNPGSNQPIFFSGDMTAIKGLLAIGGWMAGLL